MPAVAPSLPGVYFLPPPQPAGIGLPPLDVAAFVGFARRGPLHLPVAVEDLRTYQDVFGQDLALARERVVGGQTILANLPRTVAAFFANGGRRCYAVRVAGDQAAPARLHAPSLVALGVDGTVTLPAITASSPGEWGASLLLGTRLERTALPLNAFSAVSQGLAWTPGGAPQAIQPGDLLRLTTQAHSSDAGRDTFQWLFPVSDILPLSGPASPAAGTQVILATQQVWQVLASISASPPLMVQEAFRLTLDGLAPLSIGDAMLLMVDGAITFGLGAGSEQTVARGDVLLLNTTDGSSFLFPVAGIGRRSSVGSPLAVNAVEVSASLLLRVPPQDEASSAWGTIVNSALMSVERLRFDLVLRLGGEQYPAITDLAFNAGHPRFWGDVILLESSPLHRRSSADATSQTGAPTPGAPPQTTDAARAADLFRRLQAETTLAQDESPDVVSLAGLLSPVDRSLPLTYLPLDMPFDASNLTGPDPDEAGKDDLDTFDRDTARLFLDPYLVPYPGNQSTSATALMSAAFDRAYIQNVRLHGIHSLTLVDEVALIGVPDAVHRIWSPAGPEAVSPPPAPGPAPAAPPCPPEGPFSAYLQPPTLSDVQPPTGPVTGGALVTVTGTGFVSGSTSVSFGGRPAGNVEVIDATTLRCLAPVGATAGPVTIEIVTPNGAGSKTDAFTYEWPAATPDLPVMVTPEAFDLQSSPLLPVQQSVITLCQARSDVVGILSLPGHFDKRSCIEWQQELRRRLDLPARGSLIQDVREIADLSYVTVYHPWLLVADASAPGSLSSIPPEGAICGMIAARERARQVWVAPANVPLQGVVGLAPTFSRDDWAELFGLQFNLIREEWGSFRAMSAHTLADGQDLLQLSVRRLLILLRKAALQRGMDFVFEANQQIFRNGARVMLEAMLQLMFQRGAFAGATPQTAYQVVTDATVNPPESVDQGRFIAQIQVAPSQPMEFMTVLLVRTDQGLVQATEV